MSGSQQLKVSLISGGLTTGLYPYQGTKPGTQGYVGLWLESVQLLLLYAEPGVFLKKLTASIREGL